MSARGRNAVVCVDLTPTQIETLSLYAVGRVYAAEDRSETSLWRKLANACNEAKAQTTVERKPCGFCGRAVARKGRSYAAPHKCPHGDECRPHSFRPSEAACRKCREAHSNVNTSGW